MLLHTTKKKLISISFFIIGFAQIGNAQLNATIVSTENTRCNGSGCSYSGPSILINEMMMSPSSNDGSLWEPNCNNILNPRCGEWIEIYNPNLCEPVDVSCFYLGNNASDGGNYGGGYTIPAGTIIPPSGFLLLRGQNTAAIDPALLVQNGGKTIEIVVNAPNTCIGGGTRLWFPNSGSWFAFYDANGVPQDAVSWGPNPSSPANQTFSPCIATGTGCSFTGTLPSFFDIPANRKTHIYNSAIPNSWGRSMRRSPDGGAWLLNQGEANPTPGDCNDACITPNASTCAGTATVTPTDGTAPYTYSWNDSEAQTTQTATALCAGNYQVTVTDALGVTGTFSVEVFDFVPPVSIALIDEICIDGGNVSIAITPDTTGLNGLGSLQGTGLTGTEFNPQTAGAGEFFFTFDFTDSLGCHNSIKDSITVHPIPVVSIANNQSPYCISSIPADLQLTPTNGTLSGNGVSNNEFVPSNAGVGTHTLTLAYTDANGCDNSTTIDVTVVAIPEPTLTVTSPLCINDPAVVMQGSPSGGNYTINGQSSTSSFDPATVGVGTHALAYTYIDPNGCEASTTASASVLPKPVVNLVIDPVFCFETNIVPLNPSPTGGTLSGTHALGNSLDLSNADPGNYTVTYDYSDANGCENSTSQDYLVTTPIEVGFFYGTDCFQNGTFVGNLNNPAYSYNWTINGNTYVGTPNTSIQFENPGTFPMTYSVTDTYNCVYDSTAAVTIPQGLTINDFVVPNVITANNDNINDFLILPSLLTECLDYKILILNRWGNLVYEQNNNLNPFSGKDQNGNELTEGVYFYRIISDDIDCNDTKFKGFCHGNITIVKK